MTAATEGERRRIDADGVHDLVTGREAAAFHRPDFHLWVVQAADRATLDDMLQQLEALGYRHYRDFVMDEPCIFINAEGITS